MESLLGFKIEFWDYVTVVVIFVCVVIGLSFVIWLAGLPGRIAIARKHPEAEAVMIMGYAGFLPVVPWIQAFIWAFKPTDIVDIRRFPREEAKGIDEEIDRLNGASATLAAAKAAKNQKPKPDVNPAPDSYPPA
jgi:hypothetical protein